MVQKVRYLMFFKEMRGIVFNIVSLSDSHDSLRMIIDKVTKVKFRCNTWRADWPLKFGQKESICKICCC